MSIEVTRVEVDGREVPVTIDMAAGRIGLDAGGHVATIAFRMQGTQLAAVHTEVPAALRGKGVGDKLAHALLDYARAQGFTVLPYCPFVAAYVKRHAEYADLVSPDFA
jgi:predicted GNAT family acetyltransferase